MVDTEYTFSPWDDTVTAYAYDNAGNWDYDETQKPVPPFNFPIIFKHLTFRNKYQGYIGWFIINAVFEEGPLKTTLRCDVE